MSIRKKIVWLPYDMDTALGINNEGALVFDYDLEDIDHTAGGADVFNGQDSVMWRNVRAAFGPELMAMYQQLRSDGKLSYEKVEQAFEEHQRKWGESIFNEDAYFKYLQPLVEDGDGAYLAMLQGSKEEQRKWWLYNRFRYIDSKYNAGDAQSDVIQLRGYAKANITVTPYADVYASVKFGSYLQQTRAARGQSYEIVCPLDKVNDTEIYIYSASQLSAVGDLSGLKVGYADFSKATKLSAIKLGDSSSTYSNGNLKELYVGNNTLLRSLDVRNCSGLGTGDMKSVDLTGCTNIEDVYFDGTSITGVDLPNGGNLKRLHLPGTVTNLTLRNQTALTEFVMPSYANITTLWLDNYDSTVVPDETILAAMPTGGRVRLIGFETTVSSQEEVDTLYAKLDTMRGLDETGGNVNKAVVSGTIHGLTTVSRTWIAEKQAQYPNITIEYTALSNFIYYRSYDGSQLIYAEDVLPGGNGTYAGRPTRESTAQYEYTFAGWNLSKNATTADASATRNITSDRTVYAAYSQATRYYTISWLNDNGATLTTTSVAYNAIPTYSGTPTSAIDSSKMFIGWNPAVTPVTADASYTAVYAVVYRVRFYNGTSLLQTVNNVPEGGTATYTGATPTSPEEGFEFNGWSPEPTNITANTDCYAQFLDTNTPLRQYLGGTMKNYVSGPDATKIAANAFYQMTTLETVESTATVIEDSAFYYCTNLKKVDLTSTSPVTIQANAFASLAKFTHLIIRSTTVSSLAATSALTGTKIASGYGAIYVPSGLVATYKAATNWSTYADQIFPISEYPKTDFSTISDSWATIVSNPNYATDYAVGDTKKITINGVDTYMQIAAFDTDALATGSGTAAITWIAKDVTETHAMNNSATTEGGWADTAMRTYLRETILPTLPQEIRSHIAEVTKTYRTKSPNDETLSIADTVWIPSYKEVGFTGADYIESSGVVYSGVFTNNAARIKYNATTDSAINWWLRSAYSATDFRDVGYNGGEGKVNASSQFGLVLGFCTNP